MDNNDIWLGKDLPAGLMDSDIPSVEEKVKLFLQHYVSDTESLDEIRNFRFQNLSQSMLEKHAQNLEAIEWLAHETPKNVSLTDIVKWDANYVIETGTDESENPTQAESEAKLWLLEFAEFVRKILGDNAPARKYPAIDSEPRKYFFPEC